MIADPEVLSALRELRAAFNRFDAALSRVEPLLRAAGVDLQAPQRAANAGGRLVAVLEAMSPRGVVPSK